MAEKRRDNRNRVLRENDTQRKNGLYVYSYTDMYGNRKQITSWKLAATDKVPAGKRDCLCLRDKITALNNKHLNNLDMLFMATSLFTFLKCINSDVTFIFYCFYI